MIFIGIMFLRMIPIRIFNLDQRRSLEIDRLTFHGNGRFDIMAQPVSDALLDIGQLLKATRKDRQLTQEQVADMAGISRPRYREIEAGSSSARTTTLINIARALGLELMLIPQAIVPAVDALLRPHDDPDDLPAFTSNPDRSDDG